MLVLSNVTKTFQAADVETDAVSNVSLTVERGEFLAIMGPSGSGKSTLLGLLGLLDIPTSGDFHFTDHDVRRSSVSSLTDLRRKHVSFIFQAFNLIPHLTIEHNVRLGLKYRGARQENIRERVIDALRAMGLEARAHHYPSQLSGGQQQRAAIARAIVGAPSLILADEPTGNLDSVNGDRTMEILKAISNKGTTIVMVTHNSNQTKYAHRCVEMRDGKLLQ